MERIIIEGGRPLNGSIDISGMKNAALAIIFASIVCEDRCVIENLPYISDVYLALEILREIGVKTRFLSNDTVEIDTSGPIRTASPYDLARRMRASYYLIGAELARNGRASVGLPGGCDLGRRPIDQHRKAFISLGATWSEDGGCVNAMAPNGLTANNIYFDVVSVGATINTMIAATRAKGMTVIENAAREPHVVDLANFLNYCGAEISGAGTDTIKIRGVEKLHGCEYSIIPDMIEAGTFMIAAAATGGCVKLNNVIPRHLETLTAKLEEMGISVTEDDDSVTVTRDGDLRSVNIKTLPYPGFPTDLQPQISILLCLANGTSIISETIWDARFEYVKELKRMGADIEVTGQTAKIFGGEPLSAANVRAVDLRAGSAMIIAGLCAEGRTSIDDIYHIERGYYNIVPKLQGVGAKIEKVYYPDGSYIA